MTSTTQWNGSDAGHRQIVQTVVESRLGDTLGALRAILMAHRLADFNGAAVRYFLSITKGKKN